MMNRPTLAAASLALGLAACGGGSGGDSMQQAPAQSPAATETVPDSALNSSQSFVDYQMGLQASDTIEPLSLQQKLAPISDTTEPTPLT